MIGFLAIVAALVVPFVSQVDRLSTGLPQAISDARQDSTIKRLDNKYHIAEHAREHLGVLPNVVFGAAGTVLGGVVAVSTVFFLIPVPAIPATVHSADGIGSDAAGTPAAGSRRGTAYEPRR